MTYANIMMYFAVYPTLSSGEENKENKEIIINGDDPANQDYINLL